MEATDIESRHLSDHRNRDQVPSTGGTGTLTDTIAKLRNLYLLRSGFAIVWAGLLAVTASTLNSVSVVLLVIYPLVDVAAAVIDSRTSGAAAPRVPLYVNIALSLSATVGVAVAATSGRQSVLRVWGAWAIGAGIVQLIVAVRRYRLGGQWAMILSGGISALAGTSFIVQAAGPKASLTTLAGYATLGGVFFLVSGVRLHRYGAKAR